jgi:hypothetical protein
MHEYELQRKAFSTVTILVLGSVISLIAVIPVLLQETLTGSLPMKASISTSVGAGIHLLLLIGILIGRRLASLNRRVNKGINLVAAIALLILSLFIMDGAFAYLGSLYFVSGGMFLCAGCDFAAAIVSVVAFFRLRPKKKKPPQEGE